MDGLSNLQEPCQSPIPGLMGCRAWQRAECPPPLCWEGIGAAAGVIKSRAGTCWWLLRCTPAELHWRCHARRRHGRWPASLPPGAWMVHSLDAWHHTDDAAHSTAAE